MPMDWLVKPTFDIANGWEACLDAANYHEETAKAIINLHVSVNVSKQVFAREKLKPAFFLQTGDCRNSNAGSVMNAFALLTGISFTTPLIKSVSLSVVPVEYVSAYPNGDGRHSYSAKLPLVFPLAKKKAGLSRSSCMCTRRSHQIRSASESSQISALFLSAQDAARRSRFRRRHPCSSRAPESASQTGPAPGRSRCRRTPCVCGW